MFYIHALVPCSDNKYEILLRNMGGITFYITSRMKKYSHTLFTIVNNKNVKGAG